MRALKSPKACLVAALLFLPAACSIPRAAAEDGVPAADAARTRWRADYLAGKPVAAETQPGPELDQALFGAIQRVQRGECGVDLLRTTEEIARRLRLSPAEALKAEALYAGLGWRASEKASIDAQLARKEDLDSEKRRAVEARSLEIAEALKLDRNPGALAGGAVAARPGGSGSILRPHVQPRADVVQKFIDRHTPKGIVTGAAKFGAIEGGAWGLFCASDLATMPVAAACLAALGALALAAAASGGLGMIYIGKKAGVSASVMAPTLAAGAFVGIFMTAPAGNFAVAAIGAVAAGGLVVAGKKAWERYSSPRKSQGGNRK